MRQARSLANLEGVSLCSRSESGRHRAKTKELSQQLSFASFALSEHLLHLVVLDERVLLLDALLVRLEEVEAALVVLGQPVLHAENEGALAGNFDGADLLSTLPALV